MNIGIDIDDTITRNPEFFSLMSKTFLEAGHNVYIITFRENVEKTAAFLKQLNISYTELICSSIDVQMEHGINEWKGWVCQEYSIDVFFEDKPEILKRIPSSTLGMMTVNSSTILIKSLIHIHCSKLNLF